MGSVSIIKITGDQNSKTLQDCVENRYQIRRYLPFLKLDGNAIYLKCCFKTTIALRNILLFVGLG